MEYPEPTVGAVIFNPDNEVLLCKSHKWNNQYIIPGGHIELGETMEQALKREVMEETGLEIHDIQLISIVESVYHEAFHERKHFIFNDFICRTDSYNVVLNDEAEEYCWVNLNDIYRYDIGGFVKQLLVEIRNKKQSKFRTEILFGFD